MTAPQPPTPPAPPTFDPVAAAEAMTQLVEGLAMLSEAARGYRAQLIQQGWTEPIADQLAAQLLAGMQAQAMSAPAPGGRR